MSLMILVTSFSPHCTPRGPAARLLLCHLFLSWKPLQAGSTRHLFRAWASPRRKILDLPNHAHFSPVSFFLPFFLSLRFGFSLCTIISRYSLCTHCSYSSLTSSICHGETCTPCTALILCLLFAILVNLGFIASYILLFSSCTSQPE